MRFYQRLLLASCLLFLAGCGSGNGGSEVALSRLRSAPEQVIVNGTTLRLTAAVWRDFAPGGDSRLRGHTIVSPTAASIPASVHQDAVWVIQGNEVWRARVTESNRAADGASIFQEFRNGPTWSPNVLLDVVVRLRDEQGQEYLLQIKQQKMGTPM